MRSDSSGFDDSSRTLKTLKTGFEVIHTLREMNGARVSELADVLEISESAVYNYLTTLKQLEWVVKEGDKYELSLEFLILGEYVRHQNVLYSTARTEVKDLADRTGETAHLATEQNCHQINIQIEMGDLAVGDEYFSKKLERTTYHHDTATGKAILAYLDEDRVEQILDRYGLPGKTENSITSRSALFDCLETVRERGYAINDEEEVEGLRAVGAPIRTNEGEVLGAISVSGPTNRLTGDRFHEELPAEVMKTTNIIELNMNMTDRIADDAM